MKNQHIHFFSIILCLVLAIACCSCTTFPRRDLSVPEYRAKAVDAYLAEFSDSFEGSKIGPAIHEVLMRMPQDALKIILNRRRPVLFVGVCSSGTAKFASSSEVIICEKDVPAFQQGMTIIKISDSLASGSSDAIMGIVAHELAHRVLDHIRHNHVSCQAEREANRLIKSWGFAKEYAAASKEFGHAKVGDGVASCQEEAPEKKELIK
ncbi:MAG: hypothetical protein HQL24_04305 [Candidatus Omnitrophica bacterium]|nr:hypothetical protein [Candidatus Omnitrophota bacterium]